MDHSTPPRFAADSAHRCRWLRHGREAIEAMLEAIRLAQHSVRLETFIFHPDATGDAFRAALLAAQRRGVHVRVLCDAFGSINLPTSYWQEFVAAGGEFRWFNPLHIQRILYRDHRKILVVDDALAFIGGLNIGLEYNGDGVTSGWRDLGLQIEGALARELADAFNDLFARADGKHRRFQRIRRANADEVVAGHDWKLLLTSPGRGHRVLKQSLLHDIAEARSIRIISAYFLPGLKLLRSLKRAARSGAQVQLILAGKSDVRLMQIATRSLYPSLLRAGVEIYEYAPQILHAKMVIVDDVVYAGSANLDARSLGINYEVMVRLPNPALAADAGKIFTEDLRHCRRLDRQRLRRAQSWWEKFVLRWAMFLFARLDPYLARRQRKRLLNS
jgi:cardiolipin synthase